MVKEHEILIYSTEGGVEPFQKWIHSIKDAKTQRIILTRIQRLRAGLFGDSKFLAQGIHELRIDYGPGYRVYYALIGEKTILLLDGGDKSTQDKDITMAKNHLLDHRKRYR